jgi:Ca-activated chloride channel homolog
MGILIPAALALLALAVPIILLYMLKQRRMDLSVSSSLLWRRALLDRTVNAPWQRIRRNLLLLLQLLLLLLLVLSLARPFVSTQAVAEGNMVVILDASASMQSTDIDGDSRFERARQQVNSLIDGLQGEQRMTLIHAGPSAQVAVSASSNKGSLRQTLGSLSASNGKADLLPAVTLAAAAARQLGDATIIFISDGAFPSDTSLPQVPGKARYINVGASSSNVGITALSLRDAPGGPQLFASVASSGIEPVSALLAIKVDGELRESRSLDLGPRDEQTVTIPGLPLTTRIVEASLSTGEGQEDYLAADNQAWALRTSRPASNVLLVSEGNSFIEKSLNLLPNVKLFKTAPAAYAPSSAFGLTILDGTMPSPVPAGNLLLFAPPNSPLVPVSGTLSFPAIGQVLVNDPLLRFVDLSGTHLASAQRIITPTWARVLARTTNDEPLIIAGETDGRRVAVVAFDLHKSDLPLQIAFPILMANLVEWLQPQTAIDAPSFLGAGDPISIRALPEADEIRVSLPGQQESYTSLQPAPSLSFARTEALGIYTVQQIFKGQPLGPPEQFAVNLFSRQESDITPRLEIGLTGTEDTPATGTTERPLEIWPWILLASLALLTAEWWLYNRPSARLRRAKVGS